jgi:hypothetical protein
MRLTLVATSGVDRNRQACSVALLRSCMCTLCFAPLSARCLVAPIALQLANLMPRALVITPFVEVTRERIATVRAEDAQSVATHTLRTLTHFGRIVRQRRSVKTTRPHKTSRGSTFFAETRISCDLGHHQEGTQRRMEKDERLMGHHGMM